MAFQRSLLSSDPKNKNYLAKEKVQMGMPSRGHSIGKEERPGITWAVRSHCGHRRGLSWQR